MAVYISHTHTVNGIGLSTPSTWAAVRAGIAGLAASPSITDEHGEPAIVCEFPVVEQLSDALDPEVRLMHVAAASVRQVIGRIVARDGERRSAHIFLGTPPARRPASVDERAEPLRTVVARAVAGVFDDVAFTVCDAGHAAALVAVDLACRHLVGYPNAACLIVCADTLLTDECIEWLEEQHRLKSPSFGRHHGVPAGEAVCTLAIESGQTIAARGGGALARIAGVAIDEEAAPFASGAPNTARGLTNAVRAACSRAKIGGADIATVFCDLNGEHHRLREWAIAASRALEPRDAERALWHPADCLGDVGVAAGGVNLALCATAVASGTPAPALCVASDDYGVRGAVVLAPAD